MDSNLIPHETNAKNEKITGYKCTNDGVHFTFSYNKKCRYCIAVYTKPAVFITAKEQT